MEDDDSESWRAAPCLPCDGCARSGEAEALRCECGSLLARYVDGHIELKCRRCKRTVLISIEADDSHAPLAAD